MSEDLSKRLRERAGKYDEYNWYTEIVLEAADRIDDLKEKLEALTAATKKFADSVQQVNATIDKQWAEAQDQQSARINELEAALRHYQCGCKEDSCTPEKPKFRSIRCGWPAKAALAKGMQS